MPPYENLTSVSCFPWTLYVLDAHTGIPVKHDNYMSFAGIESEVDRLLPTAPNKTRYMAVDRATGNVHVVFEVKSEPSLVVVA